MSKTNIYNEPQLYITPNCKNTIRAFSRHYWEDKENLNKGKKMSKKTKSKKWAEFFLKKYENLAAVWYDYRDRKTCVRLKNGKLSIAILMKGDKWNFETGFYVAYSNALNETIKSIKSLTS